MAAIIERKAKRYGVQTFLDEWISREAIAYRRPSKRISALARSSLFLLSPSSITRQWVLAEVGGAWTLDKRIIASTYDLVPDQIPDIIEHDKSYEVNDFDRYVGELIGRRKG